MEITAEQVFVLVHHARLLRRGRGGRGRGVTANFFHAAGALGDGRLDQVRARLLPGRPIISNILLLLDVIDHHVVVQVDNLGPRLPARAPSRVPWTLARRPVLVYAHSRPVRLRTITLVPVHGLPPLLPRPRPRVGTAKTLGVGLLKWRFVTALAFARAHDGQCSIAIPQGPGSPL